MTLWGKIAGQQDLELPKVGKLILSFETKCFQKYRYI